jgi:hypothetical protein
MPASSNHEDMAYPGATSGTADAGDGSRAMGAMDGKQFESIHTVTNREVQKE